MALGIVYDLNRQSAVAPRNGHPGPLGRAGDFFADTDLPFKAFPVFFQHLSQHIYTLVPYFTPDLPTFRRIFSLS